MKVISIGRDESCDIVYDDPNISRRQAVLRLYPSGRIEIIDYSRNGTSVNGVRLGHEILTRVTRKDAVSFAGVKTLNWNEVPDPSRVYRKILFVAVAVVAAVAVAFGGWAIYKAVVGDKPVVKVVEPTTPQPTKAPEKKVEPKAPEAAQGGVNDVIEESGVFRTTPKPKPHSEAAKKRTESKKTESGSAPEQKKDTKEKTEKSEPQGQEKPASKPDAPQPKIRV